MFCWKNDYDQLPTFYNNKGEEPQIVLRQNAIPSDDEDDYFYDDDDSDIQNQSVKGREDKNQFKTGSSRNTIQRFLTSCVKIMVTSTDTSEHSWYFTFESNIVTLSMRLEVEKVQNSVMFHPL